MSGGFFKVHLLHRQRLLLIPPELQKNIRLSACFPMSGTLYVNFIDYMPPLDTQYLVVTVGQNPSALSQ